MQMSIGDSLLLSGVGMLFVFFILVLLLITVSILAKSIKLFGRSAKLQPKELKPIATEIAGEPRNDGYTFGGEVKLYDVDDTTAVLIMAIVADSTDIPINELMFKSIRAI